MLPVQFQAKPSILDKNKGKVKGSNFSLITIYNLMYSCMNNRGVDLEPTPQNLKILLKAIVSHEVGHLLDEGLRGNVSEYVQIVIDTVDDMKKAGINVSNLLKIENKMIAEESIKDKMYQIKRILIERETTAWYIARNILIFENEQEERIFNLTKECALATYNAIGIREVVIQYHMLLPYRILMKQFA